MNSNTTIITTGSFNLDSFLYKYLISNVSIPQINDFQLPKEFPEWKKINDYFALVESNELDYCKNCPNKGKVCHCILGNPKIIC